MGNLMEIHSRQTVVGTSDRCTATIGATEYVDRKKAGNNFVIWIADDDEDDRLFINDALIDNGVQGEFRFVNDG